MSSLAEHFEEDGRWPPWRIIDALIDLIVSMQPPQMTTLQYSEVIKSKVERRSTKPSNEQEQLEFARRIALVFDPTPISPLNIALANTHIATHRDLIPLSGPNLDREEAGVITTDETPRENSEPEGDINAGSATTAYEQTWCQNGPPNPTLTNPYGVEVNEVIVVAPAKPTVPSSSSRKRPASEPEVKGVSRSGRGKRRTPRGLP